jgi:antitoxin VapB
MMNTAKLTTDGTNQVVILPEDFQLSGTEVYIKKVGNAIILFSKDNPWQSLFESLDQFSDDFMTDRNQPVMQTRENF